MRVGRAARLEADRQWRRSRHAGLRWALGGIVAGAAAGVLGWAPAAWLATWVNRVSDGHVLLADAAGTIWDGDAVIVLAGGAGSRDAAALPGRVSWSLRPQGWGLSLRARQACCLDAELALHLQPGWNSFGVRFVPPAPGSGAGRIGQWPASWLAGLGTPWNTLQLGGTLRLASPGLRVSWAQGRTAVDGALQLDLDDLSSRVSPLPTLGSYRVRLNGATRGDAAAQIVLETRGGALVLSGNGQWSGAGLRFRGQAQAAEGQEAVLSNLLNIIGRRQGALSLISIG